jgi:hypothetical protein
VVAVNVGDQNHVRAVKAIKSFGSAHRINVNCEVIPAQGHGAVLDGLYGQGSVGRFNLINFGQLCLTWQPKKTEQKCEVKRRFQNNICLKRNKFYGALCFRKVISLIQITQSESSESQKGQPGYKVSGGRQGRNSRGKVLPHISIMNMIGNVSNKTAIIQYAAFLFVFRYGILFCEGYFL